MEEAEKVYYEVIFTQTAKFYFFELLEYLFDVYPLERAEHIADEIEQTAQTLYNNPHRGAIEKSNLKGEFEYRFILYSRTNRSQVKIIYRIDESKAKVFVLDFFPTEKDDAEIKSRITNT